MNSNFILSGFIAFISYALIIFVLLAYFVIHNERKTVGKKDSFNVEVISLQPPKPIVQEAKKVQQQSEPKDADQSATKPVEVQQKQTPKATLADAFNSVNVSKTATQKPQKPQYTSSYQKQTFSSKEDVTIDSIKDVTISSVNRGDIDDPVILELQQFFYQRWNPPHNVGIHEATIVAQVAKNGTIEASVKINSPSAAFNAYVEQFIKNVRFFKSIERDLKIELVLKTEE
jgi:hypothetical protein